MFGYKQAEFDINYVVQMYYFCTFAESQHAMEKCGFRSQLATQKAQKYHARGEILVCSL